jgi:hypothetical protein
MRLSVKIYTGEDYVGSITQNGKSFSLDPPDSALLRTIIAEPVFVSVGGNLEDVYADKDPVLFMENLASHYKSQGLRAGFAENLDEDDAPVRAGGGGQAPNP